MSKFIWKDHFKIGDVTVDAQHRHLFDLANQIVQATTPSELTRLFMLFYKHVREHFQAEEDLMRQHQYPDYAVHVEAHNLMLDRLIDISGTVQSGQWAKADIQAFVESWLQVHIQEVDMKFGEFLNQHRNT
ncbi:MAG: bacteriohemerythrin [Methylomonas sp.]